MARKGSEKSRPRWRIRLFLFFLLVGAGVWFLPWVASREPVRESLLAWYLPQFEGQIQMEDVSASWFSPIEMRGVRVVDAEGNLLLQASYARSEKSLAGVVGNPAQLGTFHIEEPTVHVVVREGGSNLEDAVASFLDESPDDLSSPLPQAEVRIRQATVVIQDPTGAKSELRDVAMTVTHDPAAGQPVTFSGTAAIAPSDASNPLVDLQLAGYIHPETLASEASLKTGALGLAALEPLLVRFGGEAAARGELATDVKIQFDGSSPAPRLSIVGTVDGRNIHVRSERFLAGDAIDLQELSLDMDWIVQDGKLVINRQDLVSDVGTLKAEGRFDIDRILAGDLRGLLHDEEYAADGRLDLARLANMLPALFQVREGTQFTDGELTIAVSGSQVADGRRWQGRIETSGLKGLAGGRPVAWREPVVAAWQATQSEEGELRGSASCTADFLDLKAEGTPVDATLRGTCDLNRLRDALSQFLDLSGRQLAGKLTTEFRLQQTEPATGPNLTGSAPDAPPQAAQVHATGRLRFADFVFRAADGQLWQEPNMEVAIDATGRASTRGVQRVDQALLQVTTPGDQLRATLVESVSPARLSDAWPLDVEISGALDSWYPRLQRLAVALPFEVRHIRGGIKGRLRSRVAADAVTIERADVELTQLDFQGAGYFVQEPRVVFKGDAAWSRATSLLRSKSSTLQTSALSMRVENLELGSAPSSGSFATGEVVLAADLARLQRWFHDPATTMPRQWAGALMGRAELTHAGGVTTAEWEANMNDLVVSQRASTQLLPVRGAGNSPSSPWQTVWSEREVFLSGRARHLTAEQVLELARLEVSSDTLKLAETQGKIDLGEGPLRVDLSGNVIYDLEKITALLQPYLGREVQLVGTGTRPFVIRGPLAFATSADGASATDSPTSVKALRDLTGQAALGWQQAKVYGLVAGQGELKAELRENVVHFAPLDMSLGQGRLRARPRIDLTGSSPRLMVEPGRVIEQVRLSPELCQSWLKYVAPLLAEATRADGIFSVDLSRCQVPLASPSQADMKGVLAIQSAQVRPGPVAEQLVFVAQQVEAIVKRQPLAALGASGQLAMNIPAQDLDFEVRDGRVHHQNLQLTVGDVVVRTSGSVGLDSSLQMVAEIPIQERWVARDRHLKSLAGQVIKVPLRGTLKQPQLDRRALDDLTKQMVGSAAGSFLDDAVNRGLNEGLEKLFGR